MHEYVYRLKDYQSFHCHFFFFTEHYQSMYTYVGQSDAFPLRLIMVLPVEEALNFLPQRVSNRICTYYSHLKADVRQ